VSTSAPVLTSRFWRSRRSAAIAGIVFAVLLLVALTMMRIALSEGSFQVLQTDAQRQSLIRLSLHLVPFAGIAFLWFIGVVRDLLGNVEDRLFSTVFLGSGLLFLAMLFIGAVTSTSLLTMLAGSDPNTGLFAYGRSTTQTLISVYAMRMAAVFTLSVSTVGLRTAAMPRWVVYIGYLVALTLLVAAGEHKWFQLLFPAWVLLVSVVILFVRALGRDAERE
jgi:preprotein translocase subunit Sec61beta